MSNIENNFNYNNIFIKLNEIFKNLEVDIKNDIYNINKIKTRKGKISFTDALINKLKYSELGITKLNLISEYNFNNSSSVSRTTFYEKEKLIPLITYENIFNKISNLYKELINKKTNIIAVDGTFNNTNILNKKGNLETTLNMAYFDVENNIVIDLTLNGYENKNYEILQLTNYIKKNNLNNVILILDRAYSSYEFINYLHNNNINYIIRFKNNSKNYKDRIINFKDTRVIKYQQIIEKEVFNKNYGNSSDGFKHKSVILEYLNNYTVVTNLKLEDYNDDSIKELYKKRWSVEIFFKLLKYNFKFEKIIEYNKEKNDISYKKLYLCNLIIIYLAEIIEKINKNTKKKEFINLMKPNKSNTIKGIFKTLEFIIKSKLTLEILKNISNNYVTYVKIKKGLNNDRISKTPFTKWYVKGYHNKGYDNLIVESLLKKDTSLLNKNIKLKYNKSRIKQINI
jgi:hypothetical protein